MDMLCWQKSIIWKKDIAAEMDVYIVHTSMKMYPNQGEANWILHIKFNRGDAETAE